MLQILRCMINLSHTAKRASGIKLYYHDIFESFLSYQNSFASLYGIPGSNLEEVNS